LEILLSIALVLVLLVLGMPLFGAIAIGLLVAVFYSPMTFGMVPISSYNSLDSFLLLAVPLYLLTGDLMGGGGMSRRLIDFAHVLVGGVKGGLGHVCIIVTLLFGAMCGSGLATVSAIGSVMIPRMESHGWDRRYSTALLACASPLGYLIPPSLLGILYCFVSDVSVGRIFLATVIPALIMAIGYMVVNCFMSGRWFQPIATAKPQEANTAKLGGVVSKIAKGGSRILPAMLTPVIILGGIYSGVFTVTEAAAVAAAYSLFVGFLIYRELNLKSTYRAFLQTAVSTAAIFILMVFITPYAKILIGGGAIGSMTESLFSISDNAYVSLLVLNFILIILGMFIDSIPIVLVIVPLLLPLVNEMGLDLVHAGTIILLNLGIGAVTPPFALNLYMSCRIANIPFQKSLRFMLPFVSFVAVPVLLLTTYVPEICLWLPNLIVGTG